MSSARSSSAPTASAPAAGPQLGLAAGAEQPAAAVARQQPVAALLPLRVALGQELGREEALGEVVDAEVALPPGDPDDPRPRRGLRGWPGPGSSAASTSRSPRARPRPEAGAVRDPGFASTSSSTSGACRSKAPPRWSHVVPVPGQPVPRQLGGRHDRELLVVRLVEDAVLVQPSLGPFAPVAGDPRQEDQVVVAAGDLERVELERPDPVHDPEHALRAGRAATRGGARRWRRTKNRRATARLRCWTCSGTGRW